MRIGSDCNEAIVSGQSQVRNRDRELVIKDCFCVRKTDSMLRQVGPSLGRIPLSVHGNKVCILYAYVKELRREERWDVIPDGNKQELNRGLRTKLSCFSNFAIARREAGSY